MDDGDHPAQRVEIERLQVLPADPHRPPLRVEEAQEQPCHRGFARAARPDDADLLARRDGEGKPVMGRTAPARISKINIFEGDGRKQRPAWSRRGWSVRRHQRLGGEKRIDAGRGRLAEHPLMQHHPEVAQRPKHLGSGHQHDEQRLYAHLPMRYPPHGERQRRGGADRHPAIGDAAGHDAGRQYPQRGVAQLARPLRQPAAIGRTLAERLQGRQALDAVEELEPKDLRARCRPWLERRSMWRKTVGPTRVTSAKASITAATGTSQKAIKAKIARGVSTAMQSCGTYCPKKVCNCSTPSTIDSMTPPVRSPANHAGPSAAILS